MFFHGLEIPFPSGLSHPFGTQEGCLCPTLRHFGILAYNSHEEQTILVSTTDIPDIQLAKSDTSRASDIFEEACLTQAEDF